MNRLLFQAVADYIVHGRDKLLADGTFSYPNVVIVLEAAAYLNMVSLMEVRQTNHKGCYFSKLGLHCLVTHDCFIPQDCQESLTTHVTQENCDQFEDFADSHNLAELKKKVLSIRCLNLQSYVKTSRFIELSLNNLCALLGRDDLNVTSELQVVQ